MTEFTVLEKRILPDLKTCQVAAQLVFELRQAAAGRRQGNVGQFSSLRAAAAGEQAPMFCPHWLGGGVGLVVAQHLAAVVPAGHAWLEVDANPNSLRTEFLPEGWGVEEGEAMLPAGAGLGFEPDEAALRRFTAG